MASNCKNCGAVIKKNALSGQCAYCGTAYEADIAPYHQESSYTRTTTQVQPDLVADNYANTISTPKTTPKIKDEEWRDMVYNQYQPVNTSEQKGIWYWYRKALIVFLGLWFGLYFFRFSMPDGDTNLSQHNNLLFSPIGETYYFIRAALSLVVFPLFTAWLIHKKKQSRFAKK